MSDIDPNGIKVTGATMSGVDGLLPLRTIAWRTAAWMALLLGAWLWWGASIGNPLWFAWAGGAVGSALGAISYALAHFPGPRSTPAADRIAAPSGPCAVCHHRHPADGGSCEGYVEIAKTVQRCPCYRYFAPLPEPGRRLKREAAR